ncbi:hypothetical protein MSG28_012571 [Choristoneura fumiferana]|uniref:Uncharacterized protein n=1 Tax=Choristoneura fumiferana TaxID=7141 RepID=A0ACC0JH45_CHOFU|nr:hypothetical protein MSG28_012571 [Choristoneura fumiferana]
MNLCDGEIVIVTAKGGKRKREGREATAAKFHHRSTQHKVVFARTILMIGALPLCVLNDPFSLARVKYGMYSLLGFFHLAKIWVPSKGECIAYFKAGNVHGVSMGGGDHLPSGDPPARLPASSCKNVRKRQVKKQNGVQRPREKEDDQEKITINIDKSDTTDNATITPLEVKIQNGGDKESKDFLGVPRNGHRMSFMEEESAKERMRLSLLKQCSGILRQGDQKYTKESLHKAFQDENNNNSETIQAHRYSQGNHPKEVEVGWTHMPQDGTQNPAEKRWQTGDGGPTLDRDEWRAMQDAYTALGGCGLKKKRENR